jgi:hypothetical protein
MEELSFRFAGQSVAQAVIRDLNALAPFGRQAHPGDEPEVVHIPDELWLAARAPELTLGLAGRLVPVRPSPDARCRVR